MHSPMPIFSRRSHPSDCLEAALRSLRTAGSKHTSKIEFSETDCMACDFNLRNSCFGHLYLHSLEWCLLFSFFKEFHNDEFGCLNGFKASA